MNFRGFPPGCGDSVANFWGWDAHEARLRCPDDVSGDMQEDEIPGGALSLNLLTTQSLAKNYKNDSIVSVDMGKVGDMAAYCDPLCVCVVHYIRWAVPIIKFLIM